MSEIKKAIETIKQVSDLDTKLHLNISNYDLLTAIEALQEKQERGKGCGWCDNYRMEFNAIDGDGGTVTVDHTVLGDICDFCPVCGKDLRKGENNE